MNLARVFTKTAITTPERQQEADADFVVVQQVQAGDVAAFDRLILKYRERVFGVVYNLTSNREDASDLTQETFIKAFQAINRFSRQLFLLYLALQDCRQFEPEPPAEKPDAQLL